MATPIPANRAAFELEEILRVTGGVVRRGAAARVDRVTTDSRAVAAGSLFVALRGERHDGHAFLESAAGRGAALLVVERGAAVPPGVPPSVGVVEVPDTLAAWGELAGLHLDRFRARGGRVVAITGSAGKTTTKELTGALLEALAPTHRTPGNLNNRVGVPSVIFALESRHRYVVLEMGMSLPGEIAAITRFARPDVAVVTNIGHAHAEGVGGREGVMHEKGAVYRSLEADGVAIVNVDDALAVRAASGAPAEVTFGRVASARYRLLDRDGSRIRMSANGRTLEIVSPLAGEAAAIDLAAALAAQEALTGVRLEAARIDAALSSVHLEGRATVTRLAGDTVLLDDSYNANPESMRAALATLRELAGARRSIAVLGDMLELGPYARDAHRELGDAVADAGVAMLFACGSLAQLTAERASERGVSTATLATSDEAARDLLRFVRPGDAILVKASRSIGAERVVAALKEAWPGEAKSGSSSGACRG